MSYFKAKMYQIRFWLDHLAGFKGSTSKGRGAVGKKGKDEKGGKGWEVEGRSPATSSILH